MSSIARFLLAINAVSILHVVKAVVLDVDDPQSIRSAAATVAHGVQHIYNGNTSAGVLGKFPYPPY